MEGVKFAGVFIFVLVIATNVNNAIAHGAAIIGTDNKMEEETMHELKKIEACASRCKPEEDKCRMECIKKSLGGMHKFKLDEAKFEMISVYRSIFCIAGCGSTMSELCDKKDADNCKKACQELCIKRSVIAPAAAPKKN